VLLQGFYRGNWSEGVVHIPASVGDVSAGFGDARAAGTFCARRNPGSVAMRRAPEPGPVRGDRVELYDLFLTRPRRPSAGRNVSFPQPPSIGSRIADSSLSCQPVRTTRGMNGSLRRIGFRFCREFLRK
jgi:hypothetical protein